MEPDVMNFLDLPYDEQEAVVCAALRGAAEQWGEECMPGADIGDNRVFRMEDLVTWIQAHAK